MLDKINSSLFNFSFFLSDNKKVDSLEEGAKSYGGATKYNDATYSNVEGSQYINIKDTDNEISLFIPSTNSVDKKIDNEYHINYCLRHLNRLYDITENLKFYKTKGSWYSEDKDKVIIEDITIITLRLNQLTKTDIEIFIDLANWVKSEMQQEGVSIAINTSLAIV